MEVCFLFTWVVGNPLAPLVPLAQNDTVPGNLGLACAPSPMGPYSQVSESYFPYRKG